MILLLSPKTAYLTHRLIDEAAKANIAVENFSIEELADRNFEVDVKKYDCLFIRFCYPYFEQTVQLAQRFISAGKKVVDADIATGDVGRGKWPVYERLMEAGLPMPKTERLMKAKEWQYPVIVKWTYGFGGKETFLVNNPGDLKRATDLIPPEELLLQEFVRADYEYKIITVGYKSLPVILRFSTKGGSATMSRSSGTLGGEINKENWRPDFGKAVAFNWRHSEPSASEAKNLNTSDGILRRPIISLEATQDDAVREVMSLAEQSSRLLKRELAKTDILQKGNQFYILEVNRWPGLKSFEELTGYNAAADFVSYLAKS